jgi:hypothetical protein
MEKKKSLVCGPELKPQYCQKRKKEKRKRKRKKRKSI